MTIKGISPTRGKPLRILITGGRAPVALELARLLADAGHAVFAAESVRFYLCRVSASVAGTATLPAPRQNPQRFLSELERLIVEWEIDLLIPTCEEIYWVARGRERLRTLCAVMAPELNQLHSLHHKGEFIDLAERLGLRVPQTETITDMAAWESAEKDSRRRLRFGNDGVVFKPAYSRFASRVLLPRADAEEESDMLPGDGRSETAPDPTWRSNGATKKDGKRSTVALREVSKRRAAALREVSPTVPWVAQQFIPGEAWCTYSVAHDGKLLAHAAYACRYRTGEAGASVHFRHEDDPEAMAWVSRFVGGIRFSGQIGFDFIRGNDGLLYPIECNPRATSGIHLFRSGEGLEAALTLPECLLSNNRIATPAHGASAMIGLAMLGCGFKSRIGYGRRKKWFADLRGARDAVWRKGDPKPYWEQLGVVLQAWRLGRRLGISVTEAMTQDIEWNGESE